MWICPNCNASNTSHGIGCGCCGYSGPPPITIVFNTSYPADTTQTPADLESILRKPEANDGKDNNV